MMDAYLDANNSKNKDLREWNSRRSDDQEVVIISSGILRCWLERGREKRLYWESTDTQNERRGVRRLDIHPWDFLYWVFPPYTA